MAELPWICLSWSGLVITDALALRYPRRVAQISHAIALKAGRLRSLRARRMHAAALIREGIARGALGDYESSIAINDSLISAYGASTDADLRVSVGWASVNKGFDLGELGRTEEAIEIYQALDETTPRYAPFFSLLAQGFMNWAICLGELGRHREEKQVYERIQGLLNAVEDDSAAHLLAWSYINKGIQLHDERSYETAIAMYDVVLRRWWAGVSVDTSMKMHEALAAALRHRSNALTILGRHAEAVSEVDKALSRYERTTDHGIEEEVAWAALAKAVSLNKLGRNADASKTYEFIVQRFGRTQPEQAAIAREALLRE